MEDQYQNTLTRYGSYIRIQKGLLAASNGAKKYIQSLRTDVSSIDDCDCEARDVMYRHMLLAMLDIWEKKVDARVMERCRLYIRARIEG